MTKGLSRLKTKETQKLNTASSSVLNPFALKDITEDRWQNLNEI